MSARDDIRETLDSARHKARQDKDGAHQVAMRYQSLDTQVKSMRESMDRSDRQVTLLRERRDSLTQSLQDNDEPLPKLNEELEVQLKLRLQAENELSAARELVTEVEQKLREAEQKRAGIEHKATKELLTEYCNVSVSNIQGYLQHMWWLTALPQTFQSFRRSKPAETLFYVWDEQKQRCYWAEKDDEGRPVSCSQRLGIHSADLTAEQAARLWLYRDYELLLAQWEQTREITKEKASLRYGELSLTIYNETNEFEYSPQLGMYRINKGE